jgi:hypothetical protein
MNHEAHTNEDEIRERILRRVWEALSGTKRKLERETSRTVRAEVLPNQTENRPAARPATPVETATKSRQRGEAEGGCRVESCEDGISDKEAEGCQVSVAANTSESSPATPSNGEPGLEERCNRNGAYWWTDN